MRCVAALAGLALTFASPIMTSAQASAPPPVCAIAWQTHDPDTAYSVIVARAERALAVRRWSEAAELWQWALATNDRTPEHWWSLGDALFNGNRHRESIAAYERALQLGAGTPSTGAWNIARAYAHTGNRKQALRWLARATELGFDSRLTIRDEPLFERYRADPRFGEQTNPGGATPRDRARSRLPAHFTAHAPVGKIASA